MNSAFDQDCPVAKALDVRGEKWSLLVLRDLFRNGPLRFYDLAAGLPGIAPNMLSARLKTLEKQGVIETRLYAQPPPSSAYSLTEKGPALAPVPKAHHQSGSPTDEAVINGGTISGGRNPAHPETSLSPLSRAAMTWLKSWPCLRTRPVAVITA